MRLHMSSVERAVLCSNLKRIYVCDGVQVKVIERKCELFDHTIYVNMLL